MKFGLTFGLVQVPGMPLTWQQSAADMVSGAREAEELGYDAVHMVEHHFQPDGYNPSPLMTLAACAAVTEKVDLGTNILLVPLYNPMKLAEDVAVLDNLSGGRVKLGVAPGYVREEFDGLMSPYEERFKRFEEALDLMQLAWKGEPFSFEGRFYQVPETRLSPLPVQPGGPPLWYGVSGPRLLRRAAKRGAALALSPRHTIAEVKEHLRAYDAHCDEFGHHPAERPAMREVFIAETREEAERVAAPAVTHLFKELYGKRSAKGERALTSDTGEVVSDHEQVDFANFKQRYIIGTPDDAHAAIAQLRDELGTTELHCWMHMPGIAGEDAMRSARLFAREVIPSFSDTKEPVT
jgi:alkanesulfonate monooxygenase SsuD/methylene tetrahydromethanopterin reductase-like flavin-dependent oxidoreductase (luciferase family)